MTTLIGIRAAKGKEGIILASDLSRTQTSWNPRGDVAYRQQIRSEGQKIHIDDNREIALCMTGVFDDPYIDFLANVLSGKVDLRKAIEQGYFSELSALNAVRWEGKVPNTEYINGLLVATRFDRKPRLFHCWPLGKVEEKPWESVGSGSEYAREYIQGQGKIIPTYVTLDDSVDLTVGSLDQASKDIYTGGLDLVAILEDGITEYGSEIKAALNAARESKLQDIKLRLRSVS